MKKGYSFIFSLTTIFVLILSLMAPLGSVFAEGEVPGEPTAEIQVTEPVADSTPEAPVGDAPVEDPTVEATPESTLVPDEIPQEVIGALPANTDLVVLDEQGESMPLVTEEAAEIITEGDPMWCPEKDDGTGNIYQVTPANDMDDLIQDCTNSFVRFTGANGLITELEDNSTIYKGNGVIYVATGYIANKDQGKTITINGNNLTGLSGSTLGIQGGWNFSGASGSVDYDNPSYFASSGLSIINWGGDVWVDNITTVSAPVDGLNINTTGSVSVTNSEFYQSGSFVDGELIEGFGVDIKSDFVSSENDEAPAVYLDNVVAKYNTKGGVRINANNGHVAVNNSVFKINGYDEEDLDLDHAGLTVNLGTDKDAASTNQITLDNIEAEDNSGHGVILRNHQGDTTVTNSWFEENDTAGLRVENDWGNVWLDGVTSVDNDHNGIRIEAYNPYEFGIFGNVTVLNSLAEENAATGLYIGNAGSVNVENSFFIENMNDGVHMEYVDGLVTIIESVFNFNDDHGARLDDIGGLYVSESEFSSNRGFSRDSGGLYANVYGSAYVENSFFNGNGGMQEICFWNVETETEDCFSVFTPAYGLAIQTGGFGGNGPVGLKSIIPEEGSYSTDITLSNVEANNNGAMGAGLVSNGGNINITDSIFDLNGQVCWLFGDCWFYKLIHNSNIELTTFGLEIGSRFFGPSDSVSPLISSLPTGGEVTLTNIEANNNATAGVAVWESGNTTIRNSTFNQNGFNGEATNGDPGLYVDANGTVTLNQVTANENTGSGAMISGYEVFVDTSNFNSNGQTGDWGDGLEINTYGGNIEVHNTNASGNLGSGLSISIDSFPTALIETIEGPTQTTVLVKCGNYDNNGLYGIEVLGGVATLKPASATGNVEGPYFFLGDSALFELTNCSDSEKTEDPAKLGLPINKVDVGTGGSSPLMCEKYSGTLLMLENGDKVYLPCFIQDTSSLFTTIVDALPGELPGGKDNYVSALELTVTKEGSEVNLIDDGMATVFFKVPEELKDENPSFAIMYWDETASDGKGAWVELPVKASDENGNNISYPLHDPSDGKLTVVGTYSEDGYVKVKVNYTGIFALVIK